MASFSCVRTGSQQEKIIAPRARAPDQRSAPRNTPSGGGVTCGVSFACPHFEPDDHCLRLQTDCVPGRPGCVLAGKAVFAVPVEERLRARAEEKARAAAAAAFGACPPGAERREG